MMNRFRQPLILGVLAAVLGGWSINSPVGDIQPLGGSSGGSTDPNAVHITGTETITGAKTFAADITANQNMTFAGNANVALIQMPKAGRIAFGTDIATAATSGHNGQAIMIGPVDPNSYAASGGSYYYGDNAILMGAGASILTTIGDTSDNNIAIGSVASVFANPNTTLSNHHCFRNTAIGSQYTTIQGYRSTAVGNGANTAGFNNIAIGDYAGVGTTANEFQGSIAMGRAASCQNNFSVALGTSSTTTADHQVMLGTAAETVAHPGPSSFTGLATFSGNVALNQNATMAGTSVFNWGTDATGSASVAQAIVMGPTNPNNAATNNTIVMGSGAYSTGAGARSVFIGAKAGSLQASNSSVAIGVNATVNSGTSIAIGSNAGSATVGCGQDSVCIGRNTQASNNSTGQSIALGFAAANANNVSAAIGANSATTADHQIMLGTSAETVVAPGPLTANGNSTLGSAATNYVSVGGTNRLLSPADGTLQLTSSTGTFSTLQMGGATSTTGLKLIPSNGLLTLQDATNSGAIGVSIGASAGVTAISTLGQASLGEVQVGRAVGDALRLTTTVNMRGSSDSQIGWASGNGANTTRDVSFYRSAAGVVGVNNGSGTSPNGDMTMRNLTVATNPSLSAVNPATYYRYDECDNYNTLSQFFSVNGTVGANSNSTPVGNATSSVSHPGILSVSMTGSAAGGAITGLINGIYRKSATITWQWRVTFQMPTVASTSANRYTLNVGSFNYNATAPWAGPYISYNDNVNSGNWVLNSSYGAGTITSTNTAIAVPAVGTWHVLAITLVNGLFTYVLDGTTLGTVNDTNLTAGDQWCTFAGSIQIAPSSFTTNTYAFIDSYDILVTGISR